MWAQALFKSYLRDTGGNFATMFGIMAVPILIATGMAVDISRMQSYEHQLQDAVDSAALQAVVLSAADQDERAAIARDILEENLMSMDFTITDFELKDFNDGSLSIEVDGKIPAAFAQVNGFPSMRISADAEAEAQSGEDLEMVIAFDITNSMGFDNTWETALDTLDVVLEQVEEYTGQHNFFISLVPFSDRVNVGTSRTSWLKGSTPTNWNGCVEPREENNGTVPWALDDDKPTGNNRFDASIPGVTGGLVNFNNNYPNCPSTPIVPPTSNIDTVVTAARSFSKRGTGRFDVAMAWAYRLISDEWRGQWSSGGNAAANNGHDRRKIAIMVTDGKTEAYTWEVDQVSSWGWNNGSVGGFENMVDVCTQMKADGMEIFMIRVNGNVNATSYMQDCASTNAHYLEASNNADLEIAFKTVLKVVKANAKLTH